MKCFIAVTKDKSCVVLVVSEDEKQARIMVENKTKISSDRFKIREATSLKLDNKEPFKVVKLDRRRKTTKTVLSVFDNYMDLEKKIEEVEKALEILDNLRDGKI